MQHSTSTAFQCWTLNQLAAVFYRVNGSSYLKIIFKLICR